jgi:hypothetical protein
MKKLFMITVLLISATKTLARHGVEGGISGGGGFVIDPQTPVYPNSPDSVEELIKNNGNNILKKYLVGKKQKLDAGQLLGHEIQPIEKLFKTKNNIFTVIHDTHIEVKDEESCFNEKGEPTDGSFFTNQKNAICISAKNIATKVHHEEVQPQSLALMMHEYGEVMGFTDAEAVQLQKIVLDDLKK